MKATRELVSEHDAVLVALQILENIAAAIAAKNAQAPADLERLLDFFKGFVDRCHHSKEEEVLFPELVRRGVKREGGPVDVLLAEHEVGRGHVQAMTDSLRRLQGVRSGRPPRSQGTRTPTATCCGATFTRRTMFSSR